jgi:hypothetical protein
MRKTNASTHAQPFRVTRSFLLGLCMTWCIAAGFVQAGKAAQGATLTGTWYHAENATEREQRYNAINQATENMNALARGRAREMLREKTAPLRNFTLTDEGDQVTLSMRGRRVTFTTDGSPTRATGERGAGTIQSLRQKGQLVVTIRGKTGTQTTAYHLSDDKKRLTLDISITGGKLPKPVRYQVTYISRSEYDRKRNVTTSHE